MHLDMKYESAIFLDLNWSLAPASATHVTRDGYASIQTDEAKPTFNSPESGRQVPQSQALLNRPHKKLDEAVMLCACILPIPGYSCIEQR
jgi:hypothetical protein